MRKVFDTHVHLGVWGSNEVAGRLIQPFKGREIKDYKTAELFMQGNNVAKAVFMPHYKPDQNSSYSDNYLVIEAIKRLPNAYGALYFNPEKKFTELINEHLELIQDKIVGVKMSPDAWPKGVTPDPNTWDAGFRNNMELIIETARRNRLVMHFHTGTGNSDLLNYKPFINEYGDGLMIQFVHMGGSAGGHFKLVPLFIDWLRNGYKFYCDTSFCRGFGPAWLIKQLGEEYPEGLNNVFFASDEPWGLFQSEYWRVEGIKTSDLIKDKVFYDNANKVYSR